MVLLHSDIMVPRSRRWERPVTSKICKHSVFINGHKTSISLEDEFWVALKQAAKSRGLSVFSFVEEIDHLASRGTNLSSAIRVYLFELAQKGAPS